MKRCLLILMLLSLVWPVALASATEHVETIATFDADAGEFPEGIAADRRGNLYVSLAPLGQVWKIAPDGSRSLFASLVDPSSLPLPLGALGIIVDPQGNVYVALASFDPASHGVWRISPDGATIARLPGSEAILLPNSLAFDRHHHLYVTDSLLGAVWRIKAGEAAQVWVQHDLLVGTHIPEIELPIGANGVAFWGGNRPQLGWADRNAWAQLRGTLFVANSTMKQVIRIPIDRDGQAGTPEVEVAFTGPADYLDGIAVDHRGNLYPLLIARSTLVRVTQGGEITKLATAADGLDFPASVTFGTTRDTRQTLFITNFAIFPSEDPERPGPGVVKVRLE